MIGDLPSATSVQKGEASASPLSVWHIRLGTLCDVLVRDTHANVVVFCQRYASFNPAFSHWHRPTIIQRSIADLEQELQQQQLTPSPTASAPPAPPTALTRAADFCAEAARLVGGDRAATRGDTLINSRNIAELWNAYARVKAARDGVPAFTFDAHDVGCMMELLKIARRFSGTYSADDYVDAAGYAGCAGEIAAATAAVS